MKGRFPWRGALIALGLLAAVAVVAFLFSPLEWFGADRFVGPWPGTHH